MSLGALDFGLIVDGALIQTFQPDALALLTEEVHKTRRLSHPNIVDVHSVNVDGTMLYVLMEYRAHLVN